MNKSIDFDRNATTYSRWIKRKPQYMFCCIDEERSFFSVILPIHEAFLKGEVVTTKDVGKATSTGKRRTKEQIKECILQLLSVKSLSANELYKRLGYSDNIQKHLEPV